MTKENENIPVYKPLPKRSKFQKPNKQGQIPANCVNFNFCGKHCWAADGDYDEVATDCVVLKGEFCSKFIGGIQ
jgi:hypothetical protein